MARYFCQESSLQLRIMSLEPKERMDFGFSLDGKPFVSMFIEPIKDGLIIGVSYPNIGNIHLTCISKEGRVSWHVSDGIQEEDVPRTKRFPFGGYMPEDAFLRRFEGHTKNMVRAYHGNKKAWVMTESLKRRIYKEAYKADPDRRYVPMELFNYEIVCDFDNPERWQGLRVREILNRPNEVGVITEGGVLKILRPIDERRMFCCSERQLIRFVGFLFKTLGADEYFRYLDEYKDFYLRLKSTKAISEKEQ